MYDGGIFLVRLRKGLAATSCRREHFIDDTMEANHCWGLAFIKVAEDSLAYIRP